jgi:hypothetical protein
MSRRRALTATEIFLTKRGKILLTESMGEDSLLGVATFNKNLESLGFTLSQEAFDRVKTLSHESIWLLLDSILPTLKQMVGAHRQYDPMYPNFPKQVMEMHEVELYVNALVHYWFTTKELVALPLYEKTKRPTLDEPGSLRLIELGTVQDFESIFTTLVAANSSISESDKEIVSWFLNSYRDEIERLVPESIPQKENLALLIGGAMQLGEPTYLTPLLKTATDVLRVMVVMSGGDVSLAADTKFKSFSKKERRFFLLALNQCDNATEDMLRRPEVWKRVGERLHPGQYLTRYPLAYDAFEVIRNDKPFDTFESKLERHLSKGEIRDACGLMKNRPGVFARRLDHVLRIATTHSSEDIVNEFLSVTSNVATPVLLSVYNHFRGRHERQDTRTFFPKGNVAKIQVVDSKEIHPFDLKLTLSVVNGVMGVLSERFKMLSPMGNVYIADEMANYPIPFANRSASKALRTIPRGSKMALPDGNTLRFFIWWKNSASEGRTDIDLSAILYNKDWSTGQIISFSNLRDVQMGCYHSGDITSAPKGASEFIDLDIAKMTKNGIRYVCMAINSYSGEPYCDLPECFGGWMMRQAPQSGEVYEPKTVQDKMDLTADTQFAVPLIFDIQERVSVWADVAMKSRPAATAFSSNDNLAKLSKAMMNLKKPNLFDLFFLHADARGTIVNSKEEADVIFSPYEGITPFDVDMILTEYLK